MPKGYLYILECSDSSNYVGSTINLQKRLKDHNRGHGSNYTCDRLPVTLVYFEIYQRVEEAFNREKQIQKWTSAKKKALIAGNSKLLKELSECANSTNSKYYSKIIFNTTNPDS